MQIDKTGVNGADPAENQTPSYSAEVELKSNQIKSNQIKSLLLSHHHSTSALVSEILMSVLQTVQKKQQQFTYGQYIFTDCTEDNVQNTHTYTQYT